MAKVKMTRNGQLHGQALKKGRVYDMPKATAEAYVASGQADLLADEKPAVKGRAVSKADASDDDKT